MKKIFKHFMLIISLFSISIFNFINVKALEYIEVDLLPTCDNTNKNTLYKYNEEFYMCKEIKGGKDKEKILYSNSNGSNSTITLSDTSVNYEYLEIFFGYSATSRNNSLKVYSPNNKSVTLMLNSGFSIASGVRTTNYFSGELSISGTSLTPGRHTNVAINTSSVSLVNSYGEGSTNNQIYVYRVVGLKPSIYYEYKKYSPVLGGSDMSQLSDFDIFFNDFLEQISETLNILTNNSIFLIGISSIIALAVIVLLIKLMKGGY